MPGIWRGRWPRSVLGGVALLLVLALGGRVAAQTDSGAAPAGAGATAAGMTAADIIRYRRVLASDSMRGRGPGSAGLERTARYVADQFQALGLVPVPTGDGTGGSTGSGADRTWIQRHPLVDHLTMDTEQSEAWFAGQAGDFRGPPVYTEAGAVAKVGRYLTWNTDIILASDTLLDYQAIDGPQGGLLFVLGERTTVLAGPQTAQTAQRATAASVRQADPRGEVVVYLPPPGTDSAVQQPVIDALRQTRNVVILTAEDSATFAHHRRARPPVVLGKYHPTLREPWHWVAYVRESAAVRAALRVGGIDVADLRASRTPIARDGNLAIKVLVHGVPPASAASAAGTGAATAAATATAPNVLGLLPARDSQATGYVVFTTSMEHAGEHAGLARGPSAGPADSAEATMADVAAANAAVAEVNAAGVAGLLALAQAFRRLSTQLGGLPRPIVFAAVSGSAAHFQGAAALADSLGEQMLVDLNFDLAGRVVGRPADGRGEGDALWVAGGRDVALPTPVDWVVLQHPEWRLTVADGGTSTAPTSDHWPFVWKAIPSLSVAPSAPAAPRGDAARPTIDAEPEVRLLRLLFALGREVASNAVVPHWTVEGRQHLQRLHGAP